MNLHLLIRQSLRLAGIGLSVVAMALLNLIAAVSGALIGTLVRLFTLPMRLIERGRKWSGS